MSDAYVMTTGLDVESQHGRGRASHFKVVFDSAGVDSRTLAYQYVGDGSEASPYIVDFLPGDTRNPMDFAPWKKWAITILQAIATLAVAFVSSAYSGGARLIMDEFAVSTIVSTLGISLFVSGFAVGPLLWAPLSEFYGRRTLFFCSYLALTGFNAASAGAPSMAALLVFRFLAGAFGSSPLTNSGGVIADLFPARDRGVALAVFASAPFLGPALGPVVSGFLGAAAGWRWIMALMAIFTGVLWVLVSLLIPETYAPVLLRRRAARMSDLTGNVYLSKMDMGGRTKTMGQQFRISLGRPWILLLREPIVQMISLYMAIIYGTMYMMFPAFPIVFQRGRGWSSGIGGLAFLGIAIGMCVGVAYSFLDNMRYRRVSGTHAGKAPPEARLPPAIVGSCLLPVGLFWFAWTNGPEVHWVVPIIASAFFATGLVLVFLSLMNYLIDSYVIYAASVLAANSVLRSLFGAAFPLFTPDMYDRLGIHWASAVPAFLALACMPFPVLFYTYGARIRARCTYAADAAEQLDRMRASMLAVKPAQGRESVVEAKDVVEFARSDAGDRDPALSEGGVSETESAQRKAEAKPRQDEGLWRAHAT